MRDDKSFVFVLGNASTCCYHPCTIRKTFSTAFQWYTIHPNRAESRDATSQTLSHAPLLPRATLPFYLHQFFIKRRVQGLFLIVTFNALIRSKNRFKQTKIGWVSWHLSQRTKIGMTQSFGFVLRNAGTYRYHLYTVLKMLSTAFQGYTNHLDRAKSHGATTKNLCHTLLPLDSGNFIQTSQPYFQIPTPSPLWPFRQLPRLETQSNRIFEALNSNLMYYTMHHTPLVTSKGFDLPSFYFSTQALFLLSLTPQTLNIVPIQGTLDVKSTIEFTFRHSKHKELFVKLYLFPSLPSTHCRVFYHYFYFITSSTCQQHLVVSVNFRRFHSHLWNTARD